MKTFPVIEIFGPTLQGEGTMIGYPTMFVRLGGCDFRCNWCTGPNTLVTMTSGPKRKIKDLQIGDLLIGYDEVTKTLQPTTVISTHSQVVEELYTIERPDGNMRTVATGDHQWFTKRGWVETRNLLETDEVYTSADFDLTSWKMKQSNPMQVEEIRDRMTASSKDAWNIERRDLQRQTQRQIDHGSKMIGDRNPMKDPEVVHRNAIALGTNTISGPEYRVLRLIEEFNLPYVRCTQNVLVGKRYPDFVVRDTNKAVEVYSPSFRNRGINGYAEQVVEDYSSNDWKVLALSVDSDVSDTELLGALTTFALNGTKVNVRLLSEMGKRPLKDASVYDITCHPYPAFFANNFLTHNCDSMHAVDPELVRKNAIKMTADEIITQLRACGGKKVGWVTISGGNPGLFDLFELITQLQENNWKVAVETQGTKFQGWMSIVDCLTISPKPPSAGQKSQSVGTLKPFLELYNKRNLCLKVVVFDRRDFEWAENLYQEVRNYPHYQDIPFYLSVGNADIVSDDLNVLREDAMNNLERLSHWVYDSTMKNVVILPQLHVMIWGNKIGV